MVSPGLLGALVGFASAMLTLGIPLAGYLYRIDRRAGKAVRLLTGADEVEDDGVLSRLRSVEARTNRLDEKIQDIKIDRR